jgi:ABC-type branched-subunit amino acid transport system substrate-binding protein
MYVGLISSSSVPALMGQATEKNIVLTGSPEPAGIWAPNSYFYTPFPQWPDMQLGALDWVAANVLKEPVRVGIASLDAQPGWTLVKRTKDYCARKGYTYVGEALHPVSVVEQSTEVAKMKSLNPNVILVVSHDAGHLTWLRDWAASGTPGVIQIHHWSPLSPSTLMAAGQSAVGVISYYPFRMLGYDNDNAGVKELQAMRTEWYGSDKASERLSPLYMMGFTRSLMIAEGMRMAIQAVGADKLDGKAVNQALSTLTGYDCLGLTPSINMSASDHRGYKFTRLVKVTEVGKYDPITDFIPVPPLLPAEMTAGYYAGK